MSWFEIDKSVFSGTFGLSCIENYLLYAMILEGQEHMQLYYKSFISFSDIVKSFLDDDIQYAHFNKIPRLQNVAHKNQLIELYRVFEYPTGVSKYKFCCMQVIPDFIKKRYGRELWREDHHILLSKYNDDHWCFINDNPMDIGLIGNKELTDVYGGQIIYFNILKHIDAASKLKFLKEFQQDISVPYDMYNATMNNIEVSRDILGVLRVSRKRIQEYCSMYIDTDFMVDYLHDMDKVYAALEYMRIRKKIDFEKVNKNFIDLQTQDTQIINIIKVRMEKVQWIA